MAKEDFLFDVFLSHNRAQKEWTRELARRLDEKGLKVWFDEWCLPAGTVASKGMELGVKQSRHIVLVLSPEFLESEWTDFEVQIGIVQSPANRDRKLVPLLYSTCDVPPRISRISWIDFRDAHGDEEHYAYHVQQLLSDLRPDLFERPKDFERFRKQLEAGQDPDEIPPVTPLPKGSRMPHPSSALFVGREKELRELSQSLTPGAGTLVGVHAAVTGMGGVGKTQLAIEYAHRYGHRYPGGVFWLNMENADNAVNEVAACGGPEGMDLPGFNELKAPEQAALVRKQWQESGQASLLIFDNAEDPEVVKKWRPVTGLCSVLITSRRQDWPLEMGVEALPVETLPRAKSLEMLEKARPKMAIDSKEREAADQLCHQLGDLPLALKVAAAYLQKYHAESIANYLQDLLQAPTGDAELKDVWACFAVSYYRLKVENATDALALRIFHLAAYFAPVSINRRLLAQAAELDDAKSDERRQFNQAVARLQELSLIGEEEDGRLLLHRLLRQFARAQKPLDLSQEETSLRVWNVLDDFAAKENDRGLPQELTKERTHLREAAVDAEQLSLKIAADLYNRLGFHGHMLALLQQARRDFERALAIGERVYGSDSPDVAPYLNNIGTILQEQGDLAGALEYARWALKTNEESHGPDDARVAVCANNIGTILQDQGDLVGALEYTRRALKIDEQVHGSRHPKVAIRANNIGQILQHQGDLVGALEYTRRALKIDEQVYGPDHPNVASLANNIGQILKQQGDLAGALEYTRRALKIDEQVYGLDHPNVATDASNIGQILKQQGDLVSALEYTRRALHIDEQTYGPDHPSVAVDTNNIGTILKEQGDLAGALEYMQRALKIDEQVYGPDHPAVARDANNIGSILQEQGNLAGALEYTRRSLRILMKVYGPDNPLAKKAAANLRYLEKLAEASARNPATDRPD